MFPLRQNPFEIKFYEYFLFKGAMEISKGVFLFQTIFHVENFKV